MPEAQESVDLWLDEDIVAWFQAQGDDYEARINAVLKAYVESRKQ